jgi:hypothetical protein
MSLTWTSRMVGIVANAASGSQLPDRAPLTAP